MVHPIIGGIFNPLPEGIFNQFFVTISSPLLLSDINVFANQFRWEVGWEIPPKFDLVSNLDMIWTIKGGITINRGNKNFLMLRYLHT